MAILAEPASPPVGTDGLAGPAMQAGGVPRQRTHGEVLWVRTSWRTPYAWHRESTPNLTQETLTRNRVISKAERTHALGRARGELRWDLQLTSLPRDTHTSVTAACPDSCLHTSSRNTGMMGSVIWVRKWVGNSRATCRAQTEPPKADGPSSNHPAAAHSPGSKQRPTPPLPGRGWANSHPRVSGLRTLRLWLVQEDVKPRGKGLAHGWGVTQREDLVQSTQCYLQGFIF